MKKTDVPSGDNTITLTLKRYLSGLSFSTDKKAGRFEERFIRISPNNRLLATFGAFVSVLNKISNREYNYNVLSLS
jgi:hypothetical protein